MFAEPPAPVPVPIHKVAADVEERQVARVKAVRARRDNARVQALLERLAETARDPAANLMPLTIEAVTARATMGEIVARLREVWGVYVEHPVF
jgi:methylmalonyl-CoA mutase N-terminal domain/subunit